MRKHGTIGTYPFPHKYEGCRLGFESAEHHQALPAGQEQGEEADGAECCWIVPEPHGRHGQGEGEQLDVVVRLLEVIPSLGGHLHRLLRKLMK